jgi:hypothetical protein
MSNISIANSSRHGMQRSQIPTNKEFAEIGGMDELKMN